MKTAIVTVDGRTQAVFTPETEHEKKALDILCPAIKYIGWELGRPDAETADAEIFRGSFYECKGGYVRQGSDDESLIVVREDKKKE